MDDSRDGLGARPPGARAAPAPEPSQSDARQASPPADLAEEVAALRERVLALQAENDGLRRAARVRNARGGAPLDALASQAFRLLVEHGSDVIWTADLRLRPLYLSPAVERLRGYSVQESLAQPIEEILAPESLRRARELLRRVRRSGKWHLLDAPIEVEVTHRDGRTRWTESMVTVLRDAEGRPAGFIGITRDIDERRRLRRDLEARNALLETIFANLSQIFFSLSLDPLRVEHISPACEAIYGYSEAAFRADPMTWFQPVLPEDRERVRQGFEALARGDREESVAEYRIRRPDGAIRWMRSQTRVRRGDAGKVTGLFGFVSDVTEQKELERQLLQAQKMEAVGTLAGGVAHDMNNVLGVVMGLASVLAAKIPEDDPLHHPVQGILGAARRGRSLTQNLLGFARKGGGRTERVNLNAVVEDTLDLLSRTLPKSVVLATRLEGTLDPVLGDPDQYHLVLLNLCLNASDAMPEGGTLTLVARNRRVRNPAQQPDDLPPGRYVELRVQDTGVGMDEETRARAFEPFYTTKPPGRGTGLGLAITYSTVRSAGGRVRIDSRPGEGTCVTLLLPAAEPEPATASRDARSEPPQAASETATRAPVLVVDDEPLFRNTAALMLAEAGLRSVTVESGEVALRWIEAAPPDAPCLVLLDLRMPGLGGVQTYHRLRALRPEVPVVFCSGYAGEARWEDLLALGAAALLQKPFDLKMLKDTLARALSP